MAVGIAFYYDWFYENEFNCCGLHLHMILHLLPH